jgi:hypothetical protein
MYVSYDTDVFRKEDLKKCVNLFIVSLYLMKDDQLCERMIGQRGYDVLVIN